MGRCQKCGGEVLPGATMCSRCEEPLATPPGVEPHMDLDPPPSERPVSTPRSSSTRVPSSAVLEGRFAPGEVLAGRYRIVALLGVGGMGEVYRADDLMLGLVVALKFLTRELAAHHAHLERFLSEVRLSRQVTHKNVCRVHDVGEFADQIYLSMEYVDGENLASLLRRIGRLPGDKALEIARQLCSGLAAAHEQGILHRDLKPANVMLDGRGEVRITDFGLAVLAGSASGAAARAGTPQYMAPEQLAGREVTVQSEIFSLGLVLHELFTGKRVFEASTLSELQAGHARAEVPSLSEVVPDIDPAVEHAIQRCIDPNPARRPRSALAVAAALPGGDPLAAALAAGETPSPEMVAAAGESGALRPAVAWSLAGLVLLGTLALAWLSSRAHVLRYVRPELSTEVLTHSARQLLGRLGRPMRDADSACGYIYDRDYVGWLERAPPSPERWSRLAQDLPAVLRFWYRESRTPLRAYDGGGRVSLHDPPSITPGMRGAQLSPLGRLLQYRAVPDTFARQNEAGRPVDWSPFFEAAGLELLRFTPAQPIRTPPSACDENVAWTGAFPDDPSQPLRIEAAAWHGEPVAFDALPPWHLPGDARAEKSDALARARSVLDAIVVLVAVVGGLFVVRRNMALGRGDRRGARRIAFAFVVLHLLAWLLRSDHVAGFERERGLFFQAVASALFGAGLIWLLYLALEPYVRRHWPDLLVGWSRLLGGKWRDPLVGRDVLIGLCFGVSALLIDRLHYLLGNWMTGTPPMPLMTNEDVLLGGRRALAIVPWVLSDSVSGAMALLFFFVFLCTVLRRHWLGALVFALVASLTYPGSVKSGVLALDVVIGLAFGGLLVCLMLRFGLLAMIAGFPTYSVLSACLMTADWSAWYGTSTVFVVVFIGAASVYAARLAMGGERGLRTAGVGQRSRP